ncbi:carboxymuconolactone decarboxylase family protein [Siccirubricoccus phaeus]|uniref:carboxymuconolactone decarboxylase family protein n=1 Tax=Siccirubricoccus phaeus TaxID=2595053 RepID=UPI0011F2D97A|nr:carboxymuconolactone decarboxylase family protein [Siccirubricoccus phaeus]
MRLPLLDPAQLTPGQQPLYADMRQGIEENFKGFATVDGQGRLLGPWNPWLHAPRFGGPIWELVKAVSLNPTLPRRVREVAILVTGAHFRASYEIYAHVIAAERRGLKDETLATLVAGQRPSDLTLEEACAYDVASALNRGGVLSELNWRMAVQCFGQDGATELVNLVGVYALVSVTLNGFDVPVPEEARG